MYVVLEAQYQSSLTAAVKRANATNDKARPGARRWALQTRESAALGSRLSAPCTPPQMRQGCCPAGGPGAPNCARSLRCAQHAGTLQVCFEMVGYLLEELRDGANFATFKRDVADANIFIGSLIFIEELADKVRALAAVASCPARCRCCCCSCCSCPTRWAALATSVQALQPQCFHRSLQHAPGCVPASGAL